MMGKGKKGGFLQVGQKCLPYLADKETLEVFSFQKE